MTRFAIAALMLTGIVTGPGAQGALAVFPLRDVRAGMHGTGRTVFTGDKVEDFQVEILGVLENVGPKQSIILARLSGGPLDHTGIMQGMSGSPVYLDGKLAGAVALAFPYAKDPIAGIRPIEEMLAAGVDPAEQPRRAGLVKRQQLDGSLASLLPDRNSAGFGDSRMTEVATPLSLSGFSAAAVERFAPELRKLGLEPRQGISTGGAPEDRMGDPKRLEPGSMISVELMTGDMSAGADGTLTAIDGGKVYAFGHRFLGVGPSSLPFTRSEVMALLANVNTSFKISSARELMGVISQDRNAAVTGELGQKAEMMPVDVSVTQDTKQTENYHVNVVRDPTLSPFLLQMAVFSAVDAVERASGASSVTVNGAIEFDGAHDPVRMRNIFSADTSSATAAALSAATPLAYLMQGGFDELRVRRVSVQVEAFSIRKELSIGQVYLSRREAKPGDTVQLSVQLDGDGGVSQGRTVPFVIPAGTAPGTLYFTVADGAQTTLTDLRQALNDSPRSPEQMISNANRLRASDKAYVRVWRPQPAYDVGGEDLPDPPPSVAMVLAAAQSLTQSKNSRIAEMTIDAGEMAVSGSKTVQIEVKE